MPHYPRSAEFDTDVTTRRPYLDMVESWKRVFRSIADVETAEIEARRMAEDRGLDEDTIAEMLDRAYREAHALTEIEQGTFEI